MILMHYLKDQLIFTSLMNVLTIELMLLSLLVTGITKVYNDTANTYTLTVTQADIDTDNVTEGSTNLFTTAARTRTHFTYGNGIALSGGGELSDNVTEGSQINY